ncbi:MAG: glycine cleavage system transcriptional repressor [Limisphaerales bacterium]
MQTPLVMTVIGADRPGIVEALARLVAEHDGNWLDSRMCRLGGKFAGILRVHVPVAGEAALTEALRGLSQRGLIVVVHQDPVARPAPQARLAKVELIGQDRPGIVRQISAALAALGVNFEELETECTSAPMSGETLFRARATLQLPDDCALDALRRELEKIAADLLVEIDLQPLSS